MDPQISALLYIVMFFGVVTVLFLGKITDPETRRISGIFMVASITLVILRAIGQIDDMVLSTIWINTFCLYLLYRLLREPETESPILLISAVVFFFTILGTTFFTEPVISLVVWINVFGLYLIRPKIFARA